MRKPRRHSIRMMMVSSVLALFLCSCDPEFSLFNEHEEGRYSIYGTLNASEVRNYVRVYDTNKVPILSETRELDVHVVLRNNSTSASDLMTDRVLRFEDVYTHNFFSELPIEYDTEYVITLEDPEGYRDSLSTFIPRKASVSVINPDDDCDRIVISINVFPVFFEKGEFVDFSMRFTYNDREFETDQVSSVTRLDTVLVLQYQPNEILGNALGEELAINCIDDNIGTYIFSFKHYGAQGFGQSSAIQGGELVSANSKRVLGLYEHEPVIIEVDTVRTFVNN